ncbi:MAG: hypothetical protein AUH25_04915 [Thaumarchaeota archaeon 13_1_40CM_38_12]|nr:MAG: hypothetical protein AUH25_04915 [Thaumarchaeota archaeon 13_1_40CM_38_12]
MNYQKVSESIFLKISLNRLVLLSVFGLIMLVSHLVTLPEPIMALVASIFMVFMPILLGHDLITFGKKYSLSMFQNLDVISRLIIFWIIGSLFIFHLTVFSAALKFNFMVVLLITLFVLLAGSLRENVSFRGIELQDFLNPQEKNRLDERAHNQKLSMVKKTPSTFFESRSANLCLVVIIVAICISSTLFFRMYQPFPTYMMAEFQHFGKAIQMIDALGNLTIVEKAYFVIIYANQAIASSLFNVHPLPIIWVAAFIQSVIVGGGIFAIGMLLFKKIIPSLIAAFLSLWILGGAPVQNNPYVFSDGSLSSMFFILTLYLITKNLQKHGIQLNKKNLIITFLLCLGLPASIFIQRLVVWSDSTIATLFVPFLPFALILFNRDQLIYGGRYRFSIILLAAFTFLVMLHPFNAPLYIILSCVYVILWKLLTNGDKRD